MVRLILFAALAALSMPAWAGPLAAVLPAVGTWLATNAGAIATAAATGAATAAASRALGPKAPKIPKPTTMPTPNDQAMQDARRRQIAAQQAASSRASTFLSQDDKLGGG